jgi:SAM-dependent methyltransferase
MSKHLDLGCGGVPRNPYDRDLLFGVDLRADTSNERMRSANLALHPIPFADNEFDSLSAYDFLEHIPRVLPTADGSATRFPFIELMNEIWRVLRPGGLLYACTPVYPGKAAFQDPTHVNIMTVDTHHYFVRPQRLAAMYGFVGDFAARRVQLTRPDPARAFIAPPSTAWERLRLAHRIRRGACGHLIWEFEALK